jgi:hypothetical protein
MAVVLVSIPDGQSPTLMSAMREWLDSKHFEPDNFECRAGIGGLVAQIRFAMRSDAESFAARFAGRVMAN